MPNRIMLTATTMQASFDDRKLRLTIRVLYSQRATLQQYNSINIIKTRVVSDLLFPNPTGARFYRILMANPAKAGDGFFTVATT